MHRILREHSWKGREHCFLGKAHLKEEISELKLGKEEDGRNREPVFC